MTTKYVLFVFCSYRPLSIVSFLVAVEIRQVAAADSLCGSITCTYPEECCSNNSCCKKYSGLGETWYFWVGIIASVILFLGFLTLCICYLKKSLTATLTLVHNLPNDMVIIRTVQDPNGIIRPEVARPANGRGGKLPPADASNPEFHDSMLPLDPAYPPVRALEPGALQRGNDNVRINPDFLRNPESQSLTNVSI